MNWPDDVDGDVFRRLQALSFDFERDCQVDFNIDFDHWPLTDAEAAEVGALFPGCEFIDPDQEDIAEGETNGYVEHSVTAKLRYDWVMDRQRQLSEQVAHLGGRCDSWGVLHDQ